MEEEIMKVIKKMVRRDENNKKYILDYELSDLPVNLYVEAIKLARKKGIRIEEKINYIDRSVLVRDFEYGDFIDNFLVNNDVPKLSVVEYEDNENIFDDFNELDKYLLDDFIPRHVRNKTMNGELVYSVQLNKLLRLRLSQEELHHAIEYLNSLNIRVCGYSQDLEKFDGYDYYRTYKYTKLPKSLNRIENDELFLKMAECTDENEKKRIKNEIISGNIRLAHYITYKTLKSFDVRIEDYYTYAYEALIKSVENFDAKMGFSFSSYATKCIFGNVYKAFCNSFNLTYSVAHKLVVAMSVVQNAYGKKYVEGDVDMLNDILLILSKMNVSSEVINYIYAKEKSERNYDMLLSEDNVEEGFMADEANRALYELLEQTLTEREKKIIDLFYGFADGNQHTYGEIGEELNLSSSRIGQIHAKAIRKTRRRITVHGLKNNF